MRNKMLFVFLALILAVVPIFAACAPEEEAPPPPPPPPPEEEVITLTFANFPPAPTFPCVSMEKWADEVEARTNGKVIIETFPGSTLLEWPAMFDGVLAGVADIGCSCPSYEPGRFPLIIGMETPGIKYPSTAVASQCLWEVVNEFQPASLADFKVLYMYTAGANHIATIDPVYTLGDLEGLVLRAAGAVTPIVTALGAAPEAMGMSQLPEALATGVVKGYISSYDVLMDFAFAETVKYVTDWSPSIGCSFAVVMNKDVWDSLPADVQQVIDDLGLEMSVWTGEYMDAHCAEALGWAVEEQGLEFIRISSAEQARWDALIAPIVDDYLADMAAKGLPGEEYLARLAELCELYSE